MADQVISNAKLWVDGSDYSGDVNAVALDYSAVALDNTVFSSGGAVSRVGGLRDVIMQAEGFYDPGGPTDVSARNVGSLSALSGPIVTSVGPTTGAEGEPVMSFLATRAKWGMSGKVGDLIKFTGNSEGAGGLFFGTVVANKTGIVAGGNGTGFNLGAPVSGQKVYASLHVLSYVGSGALTVTIQSDTGSGFPSPATQISFAAASVVGAQYATPVPGPIVGETWWRASWTFTGTSVAFVVNLGIN